MFNSTDHNGTTRTETAGDAGTPRGVRGVALQWSGRTGWTGV